MATNIFVTATNIFVMDENYFVTAERCFVTDENSFLIAERIFVMDENLVGKPLVYFSDGKNCFGKVQNTPVIN